MVLAMTICEICPPSEVEIMISVLLNIFDSRPSLLSLIKLMIEREVAQTGTFFVIGEWLASNPNKDSEANLFRRNSTCTRFLSAFARLHGYHYLRSLVQPLLGTMVTMPAGTTYEIDPTKAMGQDVSQNQKNIEYVALNFLQIISSSLPALPGWEIFSCENVKKWLHCPWLLAGCSEKFVPISRMLCRSQKISATTSFFLSFFLVIAQVYGPNLNLLPWALSYSYGTNLPLSRLSDLWTTLGSSLLLSSRLR